MVVHSKPLNRPQGHKQSVSVLSAFFKATWDNFLCLAPVHRSVAPHKYRFLRYRKFPFEVDIFMAIQEFRYEYFYCPEFIIPLIIEYSMINNNTHFVIVPFISFVIFILFIICWGADGWKSSFYTTIKAGYFVETNTSL